MQQTLSRSIGWWLVVCIVMTVMMVAIGGLTRLTDSGLSIVEWAPIHGVMPPLSEAEWQEELSAYRPTPEYQKINKGMSLEEFKVIYWWEYGHRLWGRLLGFVFALPLIWFVARKQMPRPFALQCVGIFALGGLQAKVGWIMVQSGLVDNPDVSPYKLTLHLWIAFIILALLTVQAARVFWPLTEKTKRSSGLLKIFAVWLFLTIGYGGVVAGMDAGLAYSSFPDFNGALLPASLSGENASLAYLMTEPGAVQFGHRMAAYALLLLGVAVWMRLTYPLRQLFAALLILQAGLGIITVHYGVPIWSASLHQVNAALLWMLTVAALYRSKQRDTAS
ncbi:MAG: COX15/CtaA family protein [Alphaproteobacteria bacterium]|nr:COX15/CtaA family protein [Alphaproteobacteria bacterium]